MNVKIQCACGTKFAFEVEPVNGRMPMNINCPGCNTSALDLANAEIARQLAPAPTPPAARVAVPPVTIRVAAPAVPPPQAAPSPVGVPRASGGALRISKTASSHAPAPAASPDSGASTQTDSAPMSSEAAQTLCPRHKTEPALETCRVCGKPICPKCMEQFGYVCSVFCRQQAARRQIEVPVYAHQKSVVTARSGRMARRMVFASIAAVVLLAGLWIWYTWFARNPKVVYSIAIAKPAYELGDKPSFLPEDFYQLIAPGRLLSIKNKRLAVFDVAQQKELWSVPLKADAANAPAKAPPMKTVKNGAGTNSVDWEALYAEDYQWANPRVIATPSDLWVSFPNSRRLDRFDPQTGAAKEVPIKNKILRVVTSSDNTLLVISGADASQTLTEIALPDGTIQTEDLPPSQPARETNSVQPTAKSGKSALSKPKSPPAATALAALSEEADADFSYQAVPDFVAAGENVVQMNTKLLEHKVIAREAMKAKGKSILESGNLTAGQSLDATQELLNDQQRERTGGKEEEDVSRYQVTLHRLLAKGIPDWTGEVIGPPEFHPLKTVDLVAAGNGLFVFNKENKKLWEAKLTYRVPSRYSREDGEATGAPWLETKDSLYFADQGILTRFDLATGNVRWRLNSVGVSSIQADQRGKLYVTSTTAGPDSIKYSQQINIYNKILPVLMKVDPDSGKVLWKAADTGDECLLSGKFVYATRTWQSIAALRLEDGPDTHFDLTLFSPSSGKEIWNYRRTNRALIRADVQNNWILLHFSDEVRILKFFSL